MWLQGHTAHIATLLCWQNISLCALFISRPSYIDYMSVCVSMWFCTFRHTEGVSIPQLSKFYAEGTENEGRMSDCLLCTSLRGGKGFFSSTKPVHPGPGDHPASSSSYRSSSRGQRGRGLALTALHNQAPSLGNSGATLHLHTVHSWQVTGGNLTICVYIRTNSRYRKRRRFVIDHV